MAAVGKISLVCHLLASAARLDEVWRVAKGVGSVHPQTRPPGKSSLGATARRRHVFPGKKGGSEIGLTRWGKGTKIMLLTDNRGLPLSVTEAAASKAEVHLIEPLLN